MLARALESSSFAPPLATFRWQTAEGNSPWRLSSEGSVLARALESSSFAPPPATFRWQTAEGNLTWRPSSEDQCSPEHRRVRASHHRRRHFSGRQPREFDLETEIGGISFTGEFTDRSDNLFSTVNGDIVVALVEEPNVELQASTHIAGNIHLGQSVSKFISEMGISGERRNLSMTMGSGTADLSLETQSGSVRIE